MEFRDLLLCQSSQLKQTQQVKSTDELIALHFDSLIQHIDTQAAARFEKLYPAENEDESDSQSIMESENEQIGEDQSEIDGKDEQDDKSQIENEVEGAEEDDDEQYDDYEEEDDHEEDKEVDASIAPSQIIRSTKDLFEETVVHDSNNHQDCSMLSQPADLSPNKLVS